MTPIGVKLRRIRNLFVLIVYAPGSRKKILSRRVAQRPWPTPAEGDVLRARRRRLRVISVEVRIERGVEVVEHATLVYTRAASRKRSRRCETATNVVRMPTGDCSIVAEFIRYHVLVRVFGGDPDAWLAHLRATGDDGDLRFVRWIRSRLRQDPALLISIRKMVDATPFWHAKEA